MVDGGAVTDIALGPEASSCISGRKGLITTFLDRFAIQVSGKAEDSGALSSVQIHISCHTIGYHYKKKVYHTDGNRKPCVPFMDSTINIAWLIHQISILNAVLTWTHVGITGDIFILGECVP